MDTIIIHLDRIAADIDEHGLAANETAIAAVVQHAQTASVAPLLVSVLADPTEAEVVRARAFGMLATELAHLPERKTAKPPALAASR